MTDGFMWPATTTREGTIDEVLTIKASPGSVEISGGDPPYHGWTLKFPSAGVDVLIKRLEAARDAAALMASQD
jgi:hypothetical protein